MFDRPVFKKLSANDTAGAPGHQGGFVVPKELEDYFPDVVGVISASTPTADVPITAELYVDGKFVKKVATRYQYQTWGGTRSPERRVTGNLGPLRQFAKKDDLLVIERSLDDRSYFRFRLHTSRSIWAAEINRLAATRRWGELFVGERPAGNVEIAQAQQQQHEREQAAFELFDRQREWKETMSRRAARDVAFKRRLLGLYGGICAMSGETIESPEGLVGLDGAHIVPVDKHGTDDPRNGLLLAKDIHWAFDQGMLGVDGQRKIIVPTAVARMPRNKTLVALNGRPLSDPNDPSGRASDEALAWHRAHVLLS